jgi:hypothetical protein
MKRVVGIVEVVGQRQVPSVDHLVEDPAHDDLVLLGSHDALLVDVAAE